MAYLKSLLEGIEAGNPGHWYTPMLSWVYGQTH